jgi:uncharacterized protein DUF3365
MRQWLAAAVFTVCLPMSMSALAQEAPDPAQVAQARAAAKELGQQLKSQLVASIKAGGPKAALGVCKTVAPALSQQIGSDRGMKVERTALKVRNPDNAPDAWERMVLEDFAGKIAAGADARRLERAEVVTDAGGASTLRYMKAIPMGAQPCLTCHGAPEPALNAEIRRLYPQDQATGFKPGELRGAFTVMAPAR